MNDMRKLIESVQVNEDNTKSYKHDFMVNKNPQDEEQWEQLIKQLERTLPTWFHTRDIKDMISSTAANKTDYAAALRNAADMIDQAVAIAFDDDRQQAESVIESDDEE